jgi:hypothetical protein
MSKGGGVNRDGQGTSRGAEQVYDRAKLVQVRRLAIFAESRCNESTINLGRFIVEVASSGGVVWGEDQMRKAMITERSS